jgi:hypothetical protein
MKKNIFGKNFEFTVCPDWTKELKESLELYPDDESGEVDVYVNIVDELEFSGMTSNNPKIFNRRSNGFQADFGVALVSWMRDSKSGVLEVAAAFKNPFKRSVRGFLRRARSMEFSTKVEWFEQVLHELVLVPTAHFFPDLAVVHAACVGSEEGCFLLTGTGGVGKSSAMLSVSGENDIGFVSDDIAILDKNGIVYPNFAWPKIYGYNCEGNNFSQVLLKGRGMFDRLHFFLRNRLNPNKVRRKIKPNDLFKKVFSKGVALKGVYFLFKESCDQIEVSELSSAEATRAAINVMNAEYQVFYKFIEWEEYNAILSGGAEFISMDEIRKNWSRIFDSAFLGIVKKVAIPIGVDHHVYQHEIGTLIKDSLKMQELKVAS